MKLIKNQLKKNIKVKSNPINNKNKCKTLNAQNILKNFKNINNNTLGDITKNTVLLIEPRRIYGLVFSLNNVYRFLKNDWNYVFYCGKSLLSYWQRILPNFIEIRPLDVDNFPRNHLYSDFCKRADVWSSLYGEYVLTIQADSWIMSNGQYDINYFIKLNKSYIGGNMSYNWGEFNKVNLPTPQIRNFNGGLSLRKRLDMIKIINTFPPMPTKSKRNHFEEAPEDVYFTIGCYKLGLPLGDDDASSHFAVHKIIKEEYFGVHNPSSHIAKQLNLQYPYLKYLNRHLNIRG
jgi:hypothetical protein